MRASCSLCQSPIPTTSEVVKSRASIWRAWLSSQSRICEENERLSGGACTPPSEIHSSTCASQAGGSAEPDPAEARIGDEQRESEEEVCFVTYYDFDALVPENARLPCPAEAWGPNRDCFAYGEIFLAQDAQSHHSIIQNFVPARFEEDHPRYDPAHPDGNFDPMHPDWKEWRCLGGEKSGEACDPTASGVCGARSNCGTVPATAVGCIAYTGGPAEIGALLRGCENRKDKRPEQAGDP